MNELYHHGIKGQKWGVRRYQNADGSLTEAGIKRYAVKGYSEDAYKSNKTRLGKAYDRVTGANKYAGRMTYSMKSKTENESRAKNYLEEQHNKQDGIKGQKWGVRRYQNADGSLTDAGKKRYNADVENLSGYSKLAASKPASMIRKNQMQRTEREIARINREKANIQNAIRELDDIGKVSTKYGGFSNSSIAKANRMAQRAQLMRNSKDLDNILAEHKKTYDKLSSMDSNAKKYRANVSKSLTKEEKAATRKGHINRVVDRQSKAIGSGAVSAGIFFAGTALTNKMLGDNYKSSAPRAAALGFIGGYSASTISQLYSDTGILKPSNSSYRR